MTRQTQFTTLEKDLAKFLRMHCYPRYVAAIFVPRPQRLVVLTVYALVSELQQIPAKVSQTMLGSLRFKWWYDQVAEVSNAPHHPIFKGIAWIYKEGLLSPQAIQQLIEAYHHAYLGQELIKQPFQYLTEMIALVMAQPVTKLMGEVEAWWHGSPHSESLIGRPQDLPPPFRGMHLLTGFLNLNQTESRFSIGAWWRLFRLHLF